MPARRTAQPDLRPAHFFVLLYKDVGALHVHRMTLRALRAPVLPALFRASCGDSHNELYITWGIYTYVILCDAWRKQAQSPCGARDNYI